MVESQEVNDELRHAALVRLSALIDTGLWYFPNMWSDNYGIHKEPAYRGIRQGVINCIVEVYDQIKDRNSDTDAARRTIVAAQREFVSRIQILLDPHTQNQEINKILAEFEVAGRMRGAPGHK